MYFSKITNQWTGSNSLQKYLLGIVKACEKQDVNDSADMKNYLEKHVQLANQTYRRCSPAKLSERGGPKDKWGPSDDVTLTVDGLFDVKLYKKAGTFAEISAPQVLSLFQS